MMALTISRILTIQKDVTCATNRCLLAIIPSAASSYENCLSFNMLYVMHPVIVQQKKAKVKVMTPWFLIETKAMKLAIRHT